MSQLGPATSPSTNEGLRQTEDPSVFVIFPEISDPNNSTIKYTNLKIAENLSISDIKNEIQQLWSIPTEHQKLFLGDVELEENSKKLVEYADQVTTNVKAIVLQSTLPPGTEIISEDLANQDEDEEMRRSYTTYNNRPTPTEDDDMEYSYWNNSSRPDSGLVGLKNQGATCYLNSLIQTLYLTPEFRKLIYHFPCQYDQLMPSLLKADDKTTVNTSTTTVPSEGNNVDQQATTQLVDPKKDIIFQMQLLFSRMQISRLSSVSTAGLTTSFGWDNSAIFVQHDVQELNRVLCDKLEEKMKGKVKPEYYTIDKLYRGIMVNLIKCTHCGKVSFREEDFYDVSLSIKGKKNILESFDEFTEVEVLKDDNAYFCEKCNSKQTAEKSIKFKSLPKILNLQLKRFEYDWQHDVRVKLNDDISFPTTLDASKYVVDIEKLHSQSNGTSKNANIIAEESALYDLFAVLVHSGSAAFGHYYAFIRNFTDGKWFKFNDEMVSSVDEDEMKATNFTGERATTWSSSYQRSATPYMLVYRRRVGNDPNFHMEPITENEIPDPILRKLQDEQKRREEFRSRREKEANSCTVTVFRNRTNLPIKRIKCDKTYTLAKLLHEVQELVKNESNETQYFRFRRIANRKNHTKRPMELYKKTDYDKSLGDLNIDKKSFIYLEQSTDPSFGGMGDFNEDREILLTVRYWNPDQKKPNTVADLIVKKSITVGNLKQLVCEKYLNQYRPENLVMVEEETTQLINFMLDDNQSLSKYNIVSGDILHLEPLCPDHYEKGNSNKVTVSMTLRYYTERKNEVTLDILESEKSFKRRSATTTATTATTTTATTATTATTTTATTATTTATTATTTTTNTTTSTTNTTSTTATPDIKTEEDPNAMDFSTTSTTTTNNSDANGMTESSTPASTNAPTTEITLMQDDDVTTLPGLKLNKSIRIHFKISVTKTQPYRQFKEVMSIVLGIPPARLRFYAREGKLYKDLNAKLSELLVKFNRETKDLTLEILEKEEILHKGDKFINLRFHNTNGEFCNHFQIQINKSKTLRDLKHQITDKMKVPPERQVLTEWYNERFYKIFSNEKQTIKDARIRKNDVLRIDVVDDPRLNVTEDDNGKMPNLAFQLAQFVAWDSPHGGRKEMQTSFPTLLTIPDSASLFDLRSEISKRTGIPIHNLNIAMANGFPIYEGYITPIKDLTKQHSDQKAEEIPPDVNADDSSKESDPDKLLRNLAAKENRDGKTYNFKAEKQVLLKKLRTQQLEVLCWEDLRDPIKKPSETASKETRNKQQRKRDAEVLKIN